MSDQHVLPERLPPTAVDARQALRFLARKGAYAVPHPAADGFAVHLDTASPEVLAIIPAPIMAQASGRGWLERDPQGNLRLATAGIKALRKVLSQSAGSPHPAKRTRQQGKASKASSPKSPARTLHEAPLAWLRRRRDKDGQPLISEAQYAAGERLAADYRRAQISRRVTSDWSGVAASRGSRRGAPDAGVELSDAAVAARERVNRAIAAVGSELAGILIDVCCHETGLESAERAQRWPQRAGKVVLQLALTSLARHYGLIAAERSPFTRLRHWGDEGYRPTIDAWT
jgi:hypothetical protein